MCIELYRTVSKTYARQVVSSASPVAQIFQSAVAQIFNLLRLWLVTRWDTCRSLPIANRRYSRLKICATLALLVCFFHPLAHAQNPTAAETAAFNSAANALKFGMFDKAR